MIRIRKEDIDNLDPKSIRILSIIFMIGTLIFGIYSVSTRSIEQAKYNELKQGGCYTYGVVVDSERIGSRKSADKYRSDGYYVVDGEEYQFSFKSSSKVYVGSEILIYYEEGNPSNYIQDGYLKGGYLSGFFFIAVAIAIAIWNVVVYYKSKQVSGAGAYNYNASANNSWGYGGNGHNSADYNTYNTYRNPTNQNPSNSNMGSTAFYKRNK